MLKSMRLLVPAAALAAALTSFAAQAQQKKPVTLQSLAEQAERMKADMPAQPVWPAQGKRFAFRKGETVMLYDIASKSEKELFSQAELTKRATPVVESVRASWENRRLQERTLQWSPDGGAILVVAGGDLFLWNEKTGKAEQLTATAERERDPKFSPDGARISFRRGAELFVMDAASKEVRQLTHDSSATRWNAMLDWVYPEELDLGTAHWWSPDSKKITYLQFEVSREEVYPQSDLLPIVAVSEPQRYPKAGSPNADVHVGVVSASGGDTKWLDYGEPRDFLTARIHWTPDSKRVLAHRLNRIQNDLQIRAAAIDGAPAATVIEEKDDYWVNLRDGFEVLKDGRMLRLGEQDGFAHIYLHAADGKPDRQITRGDWEVTEIACVDESAGRIWFSSTETSPLERQFYVVNFDGSGKRQLSKGAGTHAISMSPACDFYLDTYSSVNSPARRTIHRAEDGAEVAVFREANRKAQEEYQILEPELTSFRGKDGTLFYARVIKPANFVAGRKYPVLVSIYGGPGAQSVRNAYSGLSWEQVMAHQGYVIWQMDNRGSSGRGHKFETPIFHQLGKVELADQLEGIAHLMSLGYADPQRVGIYGWSYGGYMTLYSLLHAPDVFRAGIAGAAPSDWRNYDTIYTERYMGLPSENPEGFRLSSPVNSAGALNGELLLIHNFEDDNVLFANALQMMNALEEAGKHFQTVVYPQKAHGVAGKARQHQLEQQTLFFNEALKPR
jgi:dipeptidyl-peptidase 4